MRQSILCLVFAAAVVLLPQQSAARILHGSNQPTANAVQQQAAPADVLSPAAQLQRRSLHHAQQELSELALISLDVQLDPMPAGVTLQKGKAFTVSGTISGCFYNKIHRQAEDYPIRISVSQPAILNCSGGPGLHVRLGRDSVDHMLRKGNFEFECVATAEGTAAVTVTVDSPSNSATGSATTAKITVQA